MVTMDRHRRAGGALEFVGAKGEMGRKAGPEERRQRDQPPAAGDRIDEPGAQPGDAKGEHRRKVHRGWPAPWRRWRQSYPRRSSR